MRDDTTQAGSGWRRVVIGRNPKVTLVRIVILVATCLVVFNFILLPIQVKGISMLPTYQDRSVNFINRIPYILREPRRGEVVGLVGPRLNGTSGSFRAPGVMYMKRIVGLPGESVAFSDGKLLINGTALPEPYLKKPCDWTVAPITDGPDEYYVVGDNRSMPPDYHEHGRAKREQIIGEVLF